MDEQKRAESRTDKRESENEKKSIADIGQEGVYRGQEQRKEPNAGQDASS